jgi:hypothetical protein
MIPEIELLVKNFEYENWNKQTQIAFMETLIEQGFYVGTKNPKDPAFRARDRITRAPKALGFVNLHPYVALTSAGDEYINSSHPDEALLRQLLKFQLPSPFHTIPDGSNLDFFVKPYLEIIRLVRHFGSVSFDELMLFGMQLTNFNKFDHIVNKIETFRKEKALAQGHYRTFFSEYCEREIGSIYSIEIGQGRTATRESNERTTRKFIKTKKNNMRDYTDACFRYLHSTEIVTISQSGHSLSIPTDRISDVDFILRSISREPVFIDNVTEYKAYLFDSSNPILYSDNAVMLIEKIHHFDAAYETDSLSLSQLKDIAALLREHNKAAKLQVLVDDIKSYKKYDDINNVYDNIIANAFYDNPLMFEWNTWRAMTMLDGGNIEGNFKLDDDGQPISTAAGNMADIYGDYTDFDLLIEVTLQSGQKQYDNEGEPVARHLGKHKEQTGQTTFCLFIAPTINAATIAHFFMLHKVNIAHYGGKAVIVPLELSIFRKMIQDSFKADYIPKPEQVKAIFEYSISVADAATNELDWYEQIKSYALNWLNIA